HLSVPGGINDPGLTGPYRNHVTNIDVLFFDIVRAFNMQQIGIETPGESRIERALLLLFALGNLGWLLRYALSLNALEAAHEEPDEEIRRRDATAQAWISLVSLLVVYHRWYDLGLLYIPMIVGWNAWVDAVGTRRRVLETLL